MAPCGTRARLAACATLLATLAVACDDAGAPPRDGGIPDGSILDVTPLPLPDASWRDAEVPPLDAQIVSFCSELSGALCDAFERCSCTARMPVETCESSYRMQCELNLFGPDLRPALADGRLTFDSGAAARLITSIRDASVCLARTLEPWRVRDYYTLGGILEGTRAAGESCTEIPDTSGWGYIRLFQIDECMEGVCDAGRCVGFQSVGGTCDASHTCVELDATVRFPWEVRWASLACERPSLDQPGTCAPRRPDGSTCSQSLECSSHRCDVDDRCHPLASVGETCFDPRQCDTGFCMSTTSVCAASDVPVGAACPYGGWECASRFCSYQPDGRSLCAPAVCQLAQYASLQGLLPR